MNTEDLMKVTVSVKTVIQENVDELILTTMADYSDRYLETRISKETLVDALTEYKKSHPEAFKFKESKVSDIDLKIDSIVDEYYCADVHSESCSCNCGECRSALKKELMELVTMVQKNSKK